MIGEHPERRHHEAAVEGADDERGAVRPEPVVLQQFVETFALAVVVAEDQRRRAVAEEAAQPVEIAIHPFGREEADLDFGRSRRAASGARTSPRVACHCWRIEKEVLARWRVLAEAPGDVEMMLGFAPGPVDFLLVRMRLLFDDQCVGGEQLEQRPPLDRAVRWPTSWRVAALLIGRMVTSGRSAPERCVVRSKARIELTLSPHHSSRAGRRHAETVDVDDAAAHREFRHFGHRRPRGSSPSARANRRHLAAGARRRRRRAVAATSSADGTAVRSALARAVVTSRRSSPRSRDSSVSMRSPAISKCGSSSPSASRCG